MKMKKYIISGLCVLVIVLISSYGIHRYLLYEKKSQVISIDLGKGVTMNFKYIDSGSFIMGSKEEVGDGDETPERTVTISDPFYMGIYEVTQEQWQLVMGYNPSEFIGAKRPVENVSYEECEIFLEKLKEMYKKDFKIPTEAQWEYVCRAGNEEKWFYGDDENKCEEYGWIASNSGGETHEVGGKLPNPWGMYDIYGNVQEWCSDWYTNPYEQISVDPKGPVSGESKTIRGGAWGDYAEVCRSAYRNANGIDKRNNGTGVRIIMSIEEQE